ncbi:MAG: HAMP domain-containing histidine kinase [Burkholderiales bacterium]|nr:HAMP domain-containing histidine kinase [Burkholderiales bacterium]
MSRMLIGGWLRSMERVDQTSQEVATANARNERLARELASTQADYHAVTERLRRQVDELQEAKWALSDANTALESRVARRTAALALANKSLSEAVQELQQAQDELVRKEKLAGLGSLVAGVAHELNTPIGTALTVSTSLCHEARQIKRHVEEGVLTRSALMHYVSDSEEMGDMVERNLRMAAEIIGHFKQMAVDQTSENRRQFVLSDVVSDTLFALSPRLRRSGHLVELALDNGICLDSYPGAISQVLSNLIINALIHAFDTRAQGHMQLHSHLTDDGQGVEIVFRDDGVGISPANQKRVFDPFFTTRLGQGGTGLGMHLVYNLVTSVLGGKIRLHSTPGMGTEICLSLPLVAPHPA